MIELSAAAGWRVAVHKCRPPDTGYWGEVPAMPGCASCGATREECVANVLDAARGCLECYIEEALKSIAVPAKRKAGQRRRTGAKRETANA